ncbi:aminoglycoside phosphotransferase family protein [Paenibacillus algorifonticola]|uniref:aminoglycoside phosphotransferase family protein n=1 Tax=Paenibacillus algorifonticola TaxID=684063 RepID=UPI003D2E1100
MIELKNIARKIIADKIGDSDIIDLPIIASGMLNRIYGIKLATGQTPFVLRERVFEDDEYGQEFAAERLAYMLFDKEDVKAPELISYEPDLYKNKIAVFDYIEGQTFDIYLKKKFKDESTVMECLKNLAGQVAKIHKCYSNGFGTLDRITHSSYDASAFWESIFDKEVIAIHKYFPESSVNLRKTIKAWISVINDSPKELTRSCLVHGDLHFKNIVIRDDIPYLIDWECSRFRSSSYDLAQIMQNNLGRNPKLLKCFLECYIKSRNLEDSYMPYLKNLISIFGSYWTIRMANFIISSNLPLYDYFGTRDYYVDYLKNSEFMAYK